MTTQSKRLALLYRARRHQLFFREEFPAFYFDREIAWIKKADRPGIRAAWKNLSAEERRKYAKHVEGLSPELVKDFRFAFEGSKV